MPSASHGWLAVGYRMAPASRALADVLALILTPMGILLEARKKADNFGISQFSVL